MSTPSTERLTLLQVAASSGMAEMMIKALADEDEDLDAKDCCRAAAVQPKAEQSFNEPGVGMDDETREDGPSEDLVEGRVEPPSPPPRP